MVDPRFHEHAEAPGGITLERIIARGPRGVVWCGRQRRPSRPVAVKLPAAAALFEREARILSRLDHPSVPHLLSAVPATSEFPGHLILEWREGRSADAIAREVSREEALRIGVALFDVLDHCRSRGVVHGDVKPANVLVRSELLAEGTEEGELLSLIDFGEAQELGTAVEDESAGWTEVYAAPELRRWDRALKREDSPTAASDVYSAGLLLHQLLSGRNPLELVRGEASAGRGTQTAFEVPPPSRWMSDGDPDIDTIVLAALAADPDRRPTAGQLRDALRDHLRGLPIVLRRLGPVARTRGLLRSRPPLRWSLVAATLLLGLALAGTSVARTIVDRSTARHEEEVERQMALLGDLIARRRDSEEKLATAGLREALLSAARTLRTAGERAPPATKARLQHALGDEAAQARRHLVALAHLRGAARSWAEASSGEGLSLDDRRAAIVTRIRIGDELVVLGRSAEGGEEYRIAHEALERLADEQPLHWGVLDDLGYSFERRAWQRLSEGDFVGAAPLIRERERIARSVFDRRSGFESLDWKGIYQAHNLWKRLADELGQREECLRRTERMAEAADRMMELRPDLHEVQTRWLGIHANRLFLLAEDGALPAEELRSGLASMLRHMEERLAADAYRSHIFTLKLDLLLTELGLIARDAPAEDLARRVEELDRFIEEWIREQEPDDATRWSIADSGLRLAAMLTPALGADDPTVRQRRAQSWDRILDLDPSVLSTPSHLRVMMGELLGPSPPDEEVTRFVRDLVDRSVEGSGVRSLSLLDLQVSVLRHFGDRDAADEVERRFEVLLESHRAAGLEYRRWGGSR
jgi:hypothetical protein